MTTLNRQSVKLNAVTHGIFLNEPVSEGLSWSDTEDGKALAGISEDLVTTELKQHELRLRRCEEALAKQYARIDSVLSHSPDQGICWEELNLALQKLACVFRYHTATSNQVRACRVDMLNKAEGLSVPRRNLERNP